MHTLEQLIEGARKLRDLGATGVKLTSEANGATLEATFTPLAPPAAETKPLTEKELAQAQRDTLLHSAG